MLASGCTLLTVSWRREKGGQSSLSEDVVRLRSLEVLRRKVVRLSKAQEFDSGGGGGGKSNVPEMLKLLDRPAHRNLSQMC